MNNSIKRSVSIDTSFLGEGSYVVTYWSDGKNPTDVVKKTITVKAGKPIKVNMNSAGGYVAVVRPEQERYDFMTEQVRLYLFLG